MGNALESGSIKREWFIRKFDALGDVSSDEVARRHFAGDDGFDPFEVVHVKGNVLLNEGITEALNLIGGIAATAFSNANAYLGVGDSATAESAAHTGLQAATNKLYKAMEATYPQVSGQTITWRAVFGSTDANWAWNEFSVSNTNSDTGDNINRKVSAQGTKASGQTWTLDLQITLS